eukprot:GFUD01034866.1.p1 GENE.GFUD01034866.1~~GFUD01034866.1.p1  ORF type:complete len:414 (+),score=122.68 GFUD01034866.1:81-1322(+)
MFSLSKLLTRPSPTTTNTRLLSLTSQLLKDYYATLGVPKNANGKDIKKAYYQLAKQFHPDTNQGDPASMKKFQDVSEAYEVLSDDGKRAQYDSHGSSAGSGAGQRPDPFRDFQQASQQRGFKRGGGKGGVQWEYQSNVNPEELFKNIFGEFSRAQGGRRGFGNPFDEIFSNFQFRGGMEATCHLTFNQAAKGVTKEVEVVEADRLGNRQKKIVQVPVPAGVADGQTLRMSMGQGREVFITVRVEESDYFRREGYDVHSTASISLSQALLGGIIRITGLHEDINLRIPAGTSSHTAMTLSGRGIKHMESFNTFGDHIVNLVIKMPTRLTQEQKELIREFAYTEKDTPGTVTGVDMSKFSFRQKKDSTESPTAGTTDTTSQESEKSDNLQGTLDKITEAVNSNETVQKIKKTIFG